MNAVKAIIFDVGGTLLEGAMPWHELYERALVLARHNVSRRQMAMAYEEALERLVIARDHPAASDISPRQLLHELFAERLGLGYDRLQHAIDEVLFDHPQARHLVCVPGVQTILHQLRQRGYRLAVISNWSVDLPTTLGRMGLKDYFEAIFASDAIGYSKPDPAAFLIPVDRLGLTPAAVAYVGDLYPIDVVGARQAGLHPLLVDVMNLRLHHDVPTIDHIVRLLDIFRGNGNGLHQ